MRKSVYITGSNGAVIWMKRGNDKFKQECEERLSHPWNRETLDLEDKLAILMGDVKDEDLDEEE